MPLGNNRIKHTIPLILLNLILFSSFAPVITSGWEGEGSGEVVIETMTGTIIVSTNLETADFTIAGPKQLAGKGSFSIFSNVPAGVYTINYKEIAGYETPQLETKTLFANGKIELVGKYSQLSISTPSLREVIKQYAQEEKTKTVTVDGEQYFIVTLKRYISPLTWKPSDYTFLDHAPDVRKVYTSTDFIPILDEQLAKKIGIIDRANNLLKHGGSPGSISNQLKAIDDVLKADKNLADAEYSAVWAKSDIFTILDLCFYVEIGQPLAISRVISGIIVSQLEHYIDPERFILEGGRALLNASKLHYEEAKRIAKENTEGIYDYDTAKNYLNSLYNAYFKMVYGVDIVLPRGRITKNTAWEIAGWIPDYINHLGAKITSHLFIWGKIGVQLTKVGEIAKLATENMDKLSEFIKNVKEIPNMVAQLLEDESFPVDYTQALANQSIAMLARWGIIGVDEININLACPAELRVYDSNGNVTGTVEGEIKMEIPNSFYYNNTVTIFFPSDLYKHEITGIANGSYRLMIEYVGNKTTSFVVSDVPISVNSTHQYTIEGTPFNQTITKVTLKIDSNGDKIFERSIDLFDAKEISTVDIKPEFFKFFFFLLLVILSILSSVYLARRR